MKGKLIEVKWDDAWIDTEDVLISEAKKLKAVSRSTVGWLVSDNENELILITIDYYRLIIDINQY